LTSLTSSPARISLPKAIGWSVAFMLLGIAASAGVMAVCAVIGYGDLTRGLMALREPGLAQTIAGGVSQLLGFAFSTWVIGFRVLHLNRTHLRWAPPRTGAPGLAIGLILGAATAGVALLAAVVLANSHWSRDVGGLGDYALGRGTALVVVAGLVFALFHGLNPGITALGLGNIALAGIFLGVAFYAPGGLWTAFGAHLGWNATLAALDAPVSGLPFSIPFIDYRAGDPAWLSGGRFGPEGGLLATAAITAALLVAVRWIRKDPT
jgi:hypothetical protein